MGIYVFKTYYEQTDVNDVRLKKVRYANVDNKDDDNAYRDLYLSDMRTFFHQFLGRSLRGETILYSHELPVDGAFCIYTLLNNGFVCSNGIDFKENTISTVIDHKGHWYQVKFLYNGHKFTLRDSKNLIPSDIAKISKDFGIPEKEEILQHKDIVKSIIDHGINNHLTIGSNCLAMYRKTVSFKKLFPLLEASTDAELRQAYLGGWCYLNPRYRDKVLTDISGYVYDVNSLYPFVQVSCKFPFGQPTIFTENIEENMNGLYIIKFKACFHLKENGLPFIKNENIGKDYTIDNSELVRELTLCSVDFQNFIENYYVYQFEPIKLWKFRAIKGVFDKYVKHWYSIKKNATNPTQRTISKLFLNNLGGKFGTKTKSGYKLLEIKDGALHYTMHESHRDPIYVPVAIFMTAYARMYIMQGAKKAGNNFLYSDTDSIHSLVPLDINISDEIGDYKEEHRFDKARYVHKKTYCIHCGDEYIIKASGATDEVKYKISDKCKDIEEVFTHGLKIGGKLQRKLVKQGYIKAQTTFNIS